MTGYSASLRGAATDKSLWQSEMTGYSASLRGAATDKSCQCQGEIL
ncbi:MAG: hypothetical protein FWG98_10830 [Candidatus Cloacimonetes bacterium]|nr:hypothetical protein [Candidatus Cloacimonadota bacterium]